MTWQPLSSNIKYQHRYMSVTEDQVLTDHGDQVTYGVVHKIPGVSIVPFDGQQFYLIKQYRYPVNFTGWEFPAGHFEHESLEAAARAELSEETGLKAGKLEKLGSYHEAPGHLDQEIHIYLASSLVQGNRRLEIAEKGLVTGQFTHAQLNKMIITGAIRDGLTIVALKFFELHQTT